MKPWYTSKVFWIGALQLLAAIAIFGNQFLADPELNITEPATILLFVNGLTMVILRWLTDRPITSFAKPFDKLRPRIKQNDDARRYQLK